MTAPTPRFVLIPPRFMHAARQFLSHVTTRQPRSAPTWFTPAEAGLFARMAPADQVEGLAVLADLQAWGHGSDRELLIAGVLHDVGKSLAPSSAARFRVLASVLQVVPPAAWPRIAARNESLRVLLDHAALGADLVRQAGLPADVEHLIAGHHLPAAEQRMAALQRADARH